MSFVKALTAPVRVPAEMVLAAADVMRDLPGAVRDLRTVIDNLARLTSRGGELSELLREASELAARSGREKGPATGSRQRSRELGTRSARGSRRAG